MIREGVNGRFKKCDESGTGRDESGALGTKRADLGTKRRCCGVPTSPPAAPHPRRVPIAYAIGLPEIGSSEGLPVPREPSLLTSAAMDGEAMSASSERRPRRAVANVRRRGVGSSERGWKDTGWKPVLRKTHRLKTCATEDTQVENLCYGVSGKRPTRESDPGSAARQVAPSASPPWPARRPPRRGAW